MDWLIPAPPPPRRRLGSDLQNSGLFFSSAMVRKNAACLSSSPTDRHRSPPPTSLAPATAPASQSIGWVGGARTEPAIVEARKEDGLRGLSLRP